MKFYEICLFAILIFVLSVGTVSSQDLNQSVRSDDLQIHDVNVSTFADLNCTISSTDSQMDIDCDYIFNQTTDGNFRNGIEINRKELVINGNNHIIDADSQARIFTLNASNVTIKNIVFKNANNLAIFAANSTISTNNVTFLSNVGDNNGGAIHGENTTFSSVNDKFTDNYANKFGAAIFLDKNSKLYLANGSFKSQKDLQWGLIEIRNSQFAIADTTFRDIKSKYSSILHIERSKGEIKDCNFIDLYANMTAGAIAFADINESVKVDGCTFINSISNNNAGAVLFISAEATPDSGEDPDKVHGSFVVKNSQFINCSSQFGGALMQLDGILEIDGCNFTDNCALYNGGAVYMSYVNATVNNVNFNNNSAYYPFSGQCCCGGAIFFDTGNLTVNNSNFIDNHALNGSAVYLYGGNYTISHSNFRGDNKNYIHYLNTLNNKIC